MSDFKYAIRVNREEITAMQAAQLLSSPGRYGYNQIEVVLMVDGEPVFGYEASVYGAEASMVEGYFTRAAQVSMASIGAASPEMYRHRVALLEKAIALAEMANELIADKIVTQEEAFRLFREHRAIITQDHENHVPGEDQDCDKCADVRRELHAEQVAEAARARKAELRAARLARSGKVG